ncbi:MAG: uroporphyrinogen-III synthase, partial [Dehalococcoidia bacterium]|nr:uroporphyrinogen-III synthase [Dehalococcoidia bacterium]
EARWLVNDICDGTVAVVILFTGVGTQALVQTAKAMGRQEEFIRCLNQRMVIARSPKPARVLRQHKVHIDIMPPEPSTTKELLEAIRDVDLRDTQVGVQAYGEPNGFLTRSLAERGAIVREVALYTWGIPEDRAPVVGMIDALNQGEIDAVAFTSQPQARNLRSIAAQAGREAPMMESLNRPSVVIASVGPVCTRGLAEAGIKVDVEPDHPHMGNLVQALAQRLEHSASRLV